jgi:cytochrome c-type biogenesis protein CcmF
MDVTEDGRPLETMYPERRIYKSTEQPQSMVAIRSTVKEDLYVVFSGMNEDTGRPIIKVHVNPLVIWVWIGVNLLILGTVVALIPNAVPVRAAAPVRVQQAAEEPIGAAR